MGSNPEEATKATNATSGQTGPSAARLRCVVFVSATLAGLVDDGMPDLRDGACMDWRSSLHPRAWVGNGTPEETEAAISHCRSCPCLADCAAWLASLPARKRPAGVVAGRRLLAIGETVTYARRDQRAPVQPPVHLAVHAGLATAIGGAGDPAARLTDGQGRDLAARRAYLAAYYQAHREVILARVKANATPRTREQQRAYSSAYRAAHRDEVNARKRERRRAARAADPEAVRAADRAEYALRRERQRRVPPESPESEAG